jgi:hypothetical protein
MNIELLNKVKEKILDEPGQFIMHMWTSKELARFVRGKEVKSKRVTVNCGTAACIAGWACCITKNLNPAQFNNSFDSPLFLNALELNSEQRDLLFDFDCWPPQFRVHQNEGTRAFARQAAKRIDHFIATNGEE